MDSSAALGDLASQLLLHIVPKTIMPITISLAALTVGLLPKMFALRIVVSTNGARADHVRMRCFRRWPWARKAALKSANSSFYRILAPWRARIIQAAYRLPLEQTDEPLVGAKVRTSTSTIRRILHAENGLGALWASISRDSRIPSATPSSTCFVSIKLMGSFMCPRVRYVHIRNIPCTEIRPLF